MRYCEWPNLEIGTPCIHCGKQIKAHYDAPPRRPCGVRNPGLGDRTEQALTSLGITEARYKAAKKFLGLNPTCKCPKLKAFLNKLSEWLEQD